MKRQRHKTIGIILQTVRSDPRSVTRLEMSADTRERFIQAAADWYDALGTGVNDFDEFIAEITNRGTRR